MTDFKNLTDTITVSTQLTPDDFATLEAMGVTTIICNRVEGEEMGQPTGEAMTALATAHGMNWVSIPIGGAGFSLPDVSAMAETIEASKGPVHTYCKSGMRSAGLWGLAAAMKGTATPDEVLAKINAVGFDLSALSGPLTQLYEQSKQ